MPGRPHACRSAKATSNGKKNRLTADFPKKGCQAGDGMLAKTKKRGGGGGENRFFGQALIKS